MVMVVVMVVAVAGRSEELEAPAMANMNPSGEELCWEAEEVG